MMKPDGNEAPLSVAIITRDEEANLPRCLESVAFAAQIVVVDSGSGDGTVEIAREFGCDVYEEPWRGGFGAQKQFAIDQCREPWILVLDADERLPAATAAVIRRIANDVVPESSLVSKRALLERGKNCPSGDAPDHRSGTAPLPPLSEDKITDLSDAPEHGSRKAPLSPTRSGPDGVARQNQETLVAGAPTPAGYSFPRKNFFQGRWIRHAGWWPDRLTRLFRRGCGRMSAAAVHEGVEVAGVVADLDCPIEHRTESDLGRILRKIDRYSTLGAREAFAAGRRATVAGAVGRAGLTFLQGYLLRGGALDGPPGLTLAVTDAVNKFFKYAKLAELGRKEREGEKSERRMMKGRAAMAGGGGRESGTNGPDNQRGGEDC